MDGLGGKIGVVFAAAETLFLGSSHDLTIDEQSGCRIVIKRRYAQYGRHCLCAIRPARITREQSATTLIITRIARVKLKDYPPSARHSSSKTRHKGVVM